MYLSRTNDSAWWDYLKKEQLTNGNNPFISPEHVHLKNRLLRAKHISPGNDEKSFWPGNPLSFINDESLEAISPFLFPQRKKSIFDPLWCREKPEKWSRKCLPLFPNDFLWLLSLKKKRIFSSIFFSFWPGKNNRRKKTCFSSPHLSREMTVKDQLRF